MATALGTVIDEKYEVLKQIGKGGMSIVYLAMDKRLNKQWAVKEIRKTASGENDEIVVNSLIAEANLMKKLDHPALPRIVDIIDNGQTIYVVMDYIEGESLDRILEEYGPQPQELVVEWGLQLCDVLKYLHRQKPPIIYRDMKPANVMRKPEGNLKLIDFGIAREYKEKNLADTTILGTEGYAPPEQRGSRQTDARSDIYALGMTMHHLLTGADPRPRDYEYHPIREWNPELSEGLEIVISKCTALDPENRYQSCEELIVALDHYEEAGENFRKKQKKKVAVFETAVILAVIFLVVGFGGRFRTVYINDQDYVQKISVDDSTSYENKVLSYLEAIDLYGTDPRAYILLLKAYSENNQFGDKESNQFTGKYNAWKNCFDTESEEYLELMYQAGITYFYLYSGGDDSFRTRVQKASGYFQAIVDSGNTDFEYYSISQSYAIIGDFYNQYVDNATSVKEPTLSAYTELLESFQTCIDNTEDYESDDSAYIRMRMYKAVADLLNDHRKGFASIGVPEEDVVGVLDTIRVKTEAISVTQEMSQELRADILESYQTYVDNIVRVYTNTGERKEQQWR